MTFKELYLSSEQKRFLLVSDMSLFYTELLARLWSLATPFPSVIGRLCSQCEEWLLMCPEPILLPKCSFLQQPGGALQRTLTGLTGGQKGFVLFQIKLSEGLKGYSGEV